MWLNLHWRSCAEDRFDAWITKHHQELVLAGYLTPIGPCPDEASLKIIAKHSKKISLSDPRVDHAAKCSVCMKRILELQFEFQTRRRRLMLIATFGCCLIVISFVVMAIRRANTPQHNSDVAAIPVTIDLSDAGTNRGNQPIPFQSVSLPAALVKITIILPRYSGPGRYTVAFAHSQSRNEQLAHGSAIATGAEDRKEIAVGLDLRNFRPGEYFLSTTYELDQASTYYRLQIR
jgi:hypothetical protein